MDEGEPRRRRRRLIARGAGGVAVLLVTGALSWWAYAIHYQPLSPGMISGIQGDAMKEFTDGIDIEHVGLVGPRGSTGYLVESVWNNGDVAVRLLGVPLDYAGFGAVQWGPLPDSHRCMGCIDELHPFPTTLGAHEDVEIVIEVRQPRCPRDGGGYGGLDGFPVTFSVYGVKHTTNIPTRIPFVMCVPATALRYQVR